MNTIDLGWSLIFIRHLYPKSSARSKAQRPGNKRRKCKTQNHNDSFLLSAWKQHQKRELSYGAEWRARHRAREQG